jgi:uncharacterized protein
VRRVYRFAVAWLIGVGVGCTSAPVRYYTLTPPPVQTRPAPETTLPIEVRVVHTPPQLNRAELMVRTGPTEVTLLENERWASPVKDELKDAVRLELQRRLSRMTGWRAAFAKLTLDIDVRHLEAELGQYALFEASWSATLSAAGAPLDAGRVTTCTFRADEAIHSGYAGMIEGYQREIAALADAIVAVLTNPAGGIDASCQKTIAGSAAGSGANDHQHQQSGVEHVSPSS